MTEQTTTPSVPPEVQAAWSPESGGEFTKAQFLKIDPNETAAIRILTEKPKEVRNLCRIEIEKDGKKIGYPVVVADEDIPTVREKGARIQTRFAIVVLDRRDGEPKIWETSAQNVRAVGAIVEQWKKYPTEFDVAIKRTGKKLDTRYTLTILPNLTPLTDAEKALELPDLDEYYAPNKERLESLLKGELPSRSDSGSDEAEATVEPPDSAAEAAPAAPLPETDGINPLTGDESVV